MKVYRCNHNGKDIGECSWCDVDGLAILEDDEEEQHRRDVKHGLYGDDEEESQSEDEKAEHDRDVKRGLYGEDDEYKEDETE
jgi:hypothetical protein|tara:strand:+ start:846 stop:1091 length:246 start_codon:yes stop_codon:yes gene_type:complete